MKKTLLAALTLAALSTPGLSSAQFGSLPSLGGNKAAAGSTNLVGSQEQLVRSYVAANKDVLNANAQMAEALGLKDAAATARATAGALTEGSTQGNLADADKVVSDSTNAVAAELAKSPKLDADAKKKFSNGLGELGKGLIKYVGMRNPVQNFSSSLSSASPMDLPKLQTGSYLVKNFPAGVKALSGALSSAVSFAKSNDIPVPADANSATAAL
ncbi:hypothetical protein HNP55_004206 [Paucibacter oligotrophus]|uniref:YfdX protein n=1 Tax=Roseateles oligotrophus TaxID=1769250 RepID=A0A840LAP9_9BURK|nr:hypothetical protein [Roseateles oligotrophus]MBB4845654.1 hypothetical protein [Roseateles oligotrophus]